MFDRNYSKVEVEVEDEDWEFCALVLSPIGMNELMIKQW